MDGQRSIQEQYLPDMTCFGCGPANPKGLQLRSYAADGRTVATFVPWPEHDNGLGYLNGGIICTVLDCHSATPMFVEAERRGLIIEGAALPFVTAGLDVRYLRPTPLTGELGLSAHILTGDENEMTIEAELTAEGKTRAVAVAVWRRWRPRPS